MIEVQCVRGTMKQKCRGFSVQLKYFNKTILRFRHESFFCFFTISSISASKPSELKISLRDNI